MNLDIDIYQHLEAAAIDPVVRGWLPEGSEFPHAVVRFVSDQPLNKLKGELTTRHQRIAVDCWAKTLEGAETLCDEVQAALDGRSRTKRLAKRPLHEPETSTFRFTLEYSVWG